MIIYKITNNINNKCYIGKTNNFQRRKTEHFAEHIWNSEPNKVLYQAMRKYGRENFTMEIVEECEDSVWQEREQFFIHHYNALVPNGYNMIEGGSEPPHYRGEECPAAKLTWDEVYEIVDIIKNTTYREKNFIEIAKEYNISIDQIMRINKGEVWAIEGEQYPLRKVYFQEDEIKEIMSLLYTWEYSCEEIANMYGKSKSTIKAINNGQNWFQENILYPIKPPNVFGSKKQYKKVKELLETTKLPKTEIAKQVGVTVTVVRRVAEGKFDKYLTCND